ncbi:hypothetical protein ACTA71_008839 [Dictyostelium dimigraforme]
MTDNKQSSIPSSPPIVVPTTTTTTTTTTTDVSSFTSSPTSTQGSMTPNQTNVIVTTQPTTIQQPSSSSSSSSSNKTFESILESWKLFNIDKKKNEFGDNVTQIGALKEDCLKSRKVLAKQTQDFKKFTDDEKIKQFGSLLKLYQEEVDKLTKRSKFTETVFLGIYKDLNEISDPVPALSAALEECTKVDQTTKLEIENRKLQMQLTDFKKEFQEIQNQEVTIRRLEDKIKEMNSERSEFVSMEKLNLKEQELKQEFQQQLQASKQREQQLQKQNDQLQDELTKISITNNQIQNQLLDIKTKYEDELQSKHSEIEMLSVEFDRVQSKLTTLQRENLSIREESMVEKNSLTPMVKRVADLELEMLQKETETSKLVDQIQDLKTQISTQQDEKSNLARLYEIEKEKVEKLDKYIQNNPSPSEVELIKKELSTLKAIVDQDEINKAINDQEKDINNTSGSSNNNSSIGGDKLLKDKNRQLENECTRLRLLTNTQESELIEKNLAIDELQKVKEEQLLLIQRLEEDLSNGGVINGLNSNGNAGSLVYQQHHQHHLHHHHSLSSSQLQSSNKDLMDISDLLPTTTNTTTTTALSSSSSNNNSPLNIGGNNNNNNNNSVNTLIRSSNESFSNSPQQISGGNSNIVQSKDDKMLDIVIGQRDRFKAKIVELESDKSKLEKQLDSCRQELSSLKTDNIKLYEKIRFLQSYDKNKAGGGSGSSSGGNKEIHNKRNNSGFEKSYDVERGLDIPSSSSSSSSHSVSGGPETEEKYGKLYEESINPFLSFNKKEKYRRYREMNTAERVILNGSRFFLSNKYSRLFLFIYSVLLHLMVFLTLYRLATITTEQHEMGFGNIHQTPPLPQKDISFYSIFGKDNLINNIFRIQNIGNLENLENGGQKHHSQTTVRKLLTKLSNLKESFGHYQQLQITNNQVITMAALILRTLLDNNVFSSSDYIHTPMNPTSSSIVEVSANPQSCGVDNSFVAAACSSPSLKKDAVSLTFGSSQEISYAAMSAPLNADTSRIPDEIAPTDVNKIELGLSTAYNFGVPLVDAVSQQQQISTASSSIVSEQQTVGGSEAINTSKGGFNSGAGMLPFSIVHGSAFPKSPDVVSFQQPTQQQINDFLQMKSDGTRVVTPDGYIFREIFNPDYDDGFKQALEMYGQSFFEPTEPGKNHLHTLCNKGLYRMMVMEDDKGLVLACAFIVEVHAYKSYHMDYLAVRPGIRGGGLGGKFFKQLTTHLRNEQKYLIITFESEPKLVPWYLRMSCLHLNVISDQVTYEDGKTEFWWLLVVPLGKIIDDGSDSDTDSEHEQIPATPSTTAPNYALPLSLTEKQRNRSYILYNESGVSYEFNQQTINEIAQYLLTFMSNSKK